MEGWKSIDRSRCMCCRRCRRWPNPEIVRRWDHLILRAQRIKRLQRQFHYFGEYLQHRCPKALRDRVRKAWGP